MGLSCLKAGLVTSRPFYVGDVDGREPSPAVGHGAVGKSVSGSRSSASTVGYGSDKLFLSTRLLYFTPPGDQHCRIRDIQKEKSWLVAKL